ncbi:MAG: hypothetical protein ABH858_01325 [Candidatus Omnitrophota bacterium]
MLFSRELKFGRSSILLLICAFFLTSCVSSWQRTEKYSVRTPEDIYSPCDLDRDGDCDDDDLTLFRRSLGRCVTDDEGDNPLYNPLADADNDGCINSFDQKILFK